MSEGTFESDKALGLTIAFAVLAVVGAVVMYGAPEQMDRAWGFATAMVAALLAVAAVHLFE